MKRRLFLLIPTILSASSIALAQTTPAKSPGDAAAAQALFYEARNLAQKGHFTEACPKFEESLRLDYGIGTEFNLADCNEKVGKIASAWSGFLSVAASAKAQNQAQREKVARDRAKALEARLPKLVIEVEKPVPGLEVKRDGVVVGSAAWGTPVPVDPGSHKITATAPNKEKFEAKVDSAEGKQGKIVVKELANAHVAAAPPPVAPAPIAAKPAPVIVAPPPPQDPPPAEPPPVQTYFPEPVVERGNNTQRTIGWIVTGLGAAGLGIGAGFGIASLSKRNESNPHCVGEFCNAQGVMLRDDAIQAGNVATVASIAGGAALLGGILLIATSPSSTEEKPRTEAKNRFQPSFSIVPSGGSIGLTGTLP
jgi:hypothetical protein